MVTQSFNNKANQLINMATNSWFVGISLGIGLASLPLNSKFALVAMATPAIYHGLGLAYKGINTLLKMLT